MRTSVVTAGRAPAPARRLPGEPARESDVVVAGWRVVRQLAEGRFTAIYQATALDQDCRSTADYAIKVSRPECLANKLARAELAREALVSREMAHPRLTSVLATIQSDDAAGLVMPVLEGSSLADVLASRSETRWPIIKALWIARQIAEALAHMHELSWLHGQIQPRHVMVSPLGQVTLIDFSKSRRIGSPECDSIGMRQATYAAPEQSGGGGMYSAASDVYCLGVVLYELIAGRPPFESCDPTRLMAMHRHALPEDIRYLRPDASLEVAQLLRRMLAKEPLRRPDSEELVRWLTELEIAELACS